MNEQTNDFLLTEKIGRLMRKFAIPCVISLVVGALYNIVDQIFIANADYLGSYGNAANTVVFPMTVLALGIAVMLGDGCCASVSIALGSGRIVMKFFQIAISIAIGLAAGCIPIVGYNIGAARCDRAKKLFVYLLLAEAAVGAVATIIVECFPLQIAGLFGAAGESVYYTEFAVKCFRTYLCMMVLATVNKGTFIYLQALGKAIPSTIVTMSREVILGVVLPIVMPIFMGLDGLLWSFPVADVITFCIALVFIRQTMRELNTKSREGS